MLQIMRQYQFLLILIHGKNNKIICYIKDNTNNHNNKYLFDRINNYFDKKKIKHIKIHQIVITYHANKSIGHHKVYVREFYS